MDKLETPRTEPPKGTTTAARRAPTVVAGRTSNAPPVAVADRVGAGTARAPELLIAASFGRIETVASLEAHLQCAIELEHAILPPYLCAVYSLDPQRNRAATEVLSSILMEEMLHLTLAANLLNAVGGRPRFDRPAMLQGYPQRLPHGDASLEVSVCGFGPEALQQFLRIERPAPPGGPPQGDRYETLGQFYEAIRQALCNVCADLGEAAVFRGDPARQVTAELSYGGSGRIVAVDSLPTALAALEEIVQQGEGASEAEVWDDDRDMFHPERDEVAHYYRIQELVLGRRYRRGDAPRSGPTGDAVVVDPDGIWPMRPNPRIADHPEGDPVRGDQEAFNRTYSDLLAALDRAFDGNPQTFGDAVGAMYGLKAKARALMQIPTEDGLATEGPTFEYVAPEDRR